MGVNFDVKTDPNMDEVLTQLRERKAEPSGCPLMNRRIWRNGPKIPLGAAYVVALNSPKGSHDATFLPITPTSIF